jgi:predicted nucleic acid-binding protein
VIRVTVDSNIFISALEFQGVGLRLIAMARSGSIRIGTSDAILAETIGVLRTSFIGTATGFILPGLSC